MPASGPSMQRTLNAMNSAYICQLMSDCYPRIRLTSAIAISPSSQPNARTMYNRTKHRRRTAITDRPTITADVTKIARLRPSRGGLPIFTCERGQTGRNSFTRQETFKRSPGCGRRRLHVGARSARTVETQCDAMQSKLFHDGRARADSVAIQQTQQMLRNAQGNSPGVTAGTAQPATICLPTAVAAVESCTPLNSRSIDGSPQGLRYTSHQRRSNPAWAMAPGETCCVCSRESRAVPFPLPFRVEMQD